MSGRDTTAPRASSHGRAGSGVAGLARAPHVAALLFGSGLSALVYQIAWQREFRLIFGSSTAASAAVLSIFIGGMGAGGLLLGGRSDKAPRPLRFYAGLELLIAGFASLTPPLFDLVRAVYVRLGGTMALGVGLGTLLRLVLAAVVLAVPTLLMGGTLPAAARSVQPDADARRRTVGFLYASNTLGAVAGALVATFWLLEGFGTRASLWVACAANVGIALAARRLDGALGTRSVDPIPAGGSAGGVAAERDAPAPAISPWFVLLSAGVSGFAFFLMELVWYRMLAPLLGGSVYTFGLILAVALLGIGLGGLLYARFGKNTPATLAGFAVTCVLEALCVAFPFALGDRVALLALATYPGGGSRLLAFLPGWLAVTAVVILPAAVVAGVQYPLFIALLGAGRSRVGRHLGAAAACNTAGAMLGSLSGGFFLLPVLFATGSWRMVALLLSALGLVALFFALRIEGSKLRLLSVPALFCATLICIASRGPTAAWRHTPIGAGRVDKLYIAAPNAFRAWLNDTRRSIVWETEGRESSVALDGTDGLAMVVNGKIDGNARGDAATQVMGGLLGALLHPHPRSAMVIGLGTGSSAGWLGAVPSIERVDVAELESSMREVARRCAVVNADVLSNPKVRILIGDAREILLTIPARYDVIFSEPSNPYRAGIASLFTREYYRAVQSRLENGGMFLQWVQMYEVDADTVRTIYATLGSVFAEVETWYLGSSDLVLIGSDRPLSHDARALRARAAEEPYRRALSVAWRTEGLEGVLAHYVATPAFATEIAARPGQVINTDDRNRVEFGFARGVGNFDRVDELFEPLRKRKENRPLLMNDDVDWSRVAEERLMQIAGEGTEPGIPEGLTVVEELRASAAVNYVAGNIEGALTKWQFQDREPIGPTELGLVAEGLAQAGSKDALAVIDRLAAFQPIEADVARARLVLRQGNREEAIRLLGQALIRFRDDPWPSSSIMGRALELAKEIAAMGEEPALRMMELVGEPFAVRSIDMQRRQAALWIATNLPHSNHCALAWREFEPHPPWDVDSLAARRDCYQKWNHSRLDRAEKDLDQYTRCALSFGWLRCL